MKFDDTSNRPFLLFQFAALFPLLTACGPYSPANSPPALVEDAVGDGSELPASPLDATAIKGEVAADAPADTNAPADSAAMDQDAAETAPAIPPVLDLGPPYKLSGFGCVLPDPPSPSAECAAKVCPEGQGCMGAGHCHPLVPTMLDDPPGGALNPTVAVNGDRWGIAYSTRAPDQDSLNLQVRFFGEGGAAVGEILTLTNDTAVLHRNAQLFSAGDHGWLVGWLTEDLLTGFNGLRVRPISPQGLASGPEVVIAKNTSAWFTPVLGPRFAKLPSEGSVVAVWAGGMNGDKQAVYVQPLDSNGAMLTAPIKVSNPDDLSWAPTVTALPDGALVVWGAWLQGNKKNPVRVIARKLRPDGVPVAPQFQLPEFGKPYEGLPTVVGFSDGSAFVARALGAATTKSVPVAYDGLLLTQAAPTAVIKELPQFGSDTSPKMFHAPIAAHFPGRAVVTWHDYGTGGSIYLKHYYRNTNAMDCDATEVASPNIPDASTYYWGPSVATFADGRVLVAWSTQTKDATGLQTMRTVVRVLPQ